VRLDSIKALCIRIINSNMVRFWGITVVCLYYYLVYQSVVLDDAFIYFRIVNNLLETGKPIFNSGDSYFVATSPLWVVFLAIGKLALPFLTLELISKLWWAILLTAASVFGYSTLSRFIGKWAVFTPCVFFLSPVISSMTGNEIALLYLAMFGLLWACIFQKPVYGGLFLGIGYLARGEFILAAIPLFYYFYKQGIDSKHIISDLTTTSFVALFVIIPWHGYYFLTFNSFFPETFSIKMLQGQSGQWKLFYQVIFYSLYPLMGGRLYLLLLTVIGAWKQPYLFRFMASYTFLHTVMYTVLKIPYYHWYYYDYDIFVLMLTFFGAIGLIEIGFVFIKELIKAGQLSSQVEKKYLPVSSLVFLFLFTLTFPIQLNLFLPSHFSDIYQNNGTDRRYNSYMEVCNQLLKEITPDDIVMSEEIGLISYILKNQEIRDTNGIASPNTTLSNINNWNYFVDYYKPRYIIYRGNDLETFRYYKYNDSTYVYKQYYLIPKTKEKLLTSIYIRVDPNE